MTEAGAVRPGGRTAAVRAAVLRATGDMLVESGLRGLELTDVAARAGVGKSTVYRRWGSVPALVTDLLCDMAATSLPRADTGSLLGDLRSNAALVRRTLSDRRQGRLFKAVIAAATYDLRTAEALSTFYERRVAEWSGCVVDAVARGEAPEGTDAAAAIRQVSAPLYYQFLTSTKPLTTKDA
jgi:AcrR family transcriptional regulator